MDADSLRLDPPGEPPDLEYYAKRLSGPGLDPHERLSFDEYRDYVGALSLSSMPATIKGNDTMWNGQVDYVGGKRFAALCEQAWLRAGLTPPPPPVKRAPPAPTVQAPPPTAPVPVPVHAPMSLDVRILSFLAESGPTRLRDICLALGTDRDETKAALSTMRATGSVLTEGVTSGTKYRPAM